MKKTLVLIVSVLALLGIGNAVSACEEIDFDSHGTLCVDVIKDGNTYNLDIDYDLSISYSSAYYYVLLPNNGGGLLSPRLTNSYTEFSYNHNNYDEYNSEIRKIKVYAIVGNEVRSVEAYYDFDNGERSDENGSSSSSSTSNGDLDNFYITLSDSTPAEDDEVTLNIKARDNDDDQLANYDGSNDAEITIQYRTSPTSTRQTASTSQVAIDDKTPNFSNGSASTHITFKYEYEYKVTVTDDGENIDDYEIFDVGGSSSSSTSNGDLDNFYITLSDSTPAEDDEVTLNIKARDNDDDQLANYDGSNADVTVEYRISSSLSRHDAIAANYADIDDETPNFSNGSASTHITFKYDYEYRITVTDDSEDIEDYKIFDVGGSSSSSTSNNDIDNFYVTNSDSSPDTNEWIDLTIKARDNNNSTVTDYTDDVDFTVYYRTSSSTVWTPTTSSNYYTMGSSYTNGYDFSTSDYGIATLDNFIKFTQSREYKVVVEDANDENINGYTVFDLRNQTSNVDGFTVSEIDAVTKIYNSRNRMITNLKSSYSKLRSNDTRLEMSDTFYDNMKEVIDDESNKTFEDYSEYLDAFRDRYNYTIDHR